MARIGPTTYDRLATLARSGVPLRQSAELLAGSRIGAALAKGSGIADALAAAGAPAFDVAWVRAHEISGRTAEGLARLADSIRQKRRRVASLAARFVYPLLLIHMAALLPAVVEAVGGRPAAGVAAIRLLEVDGPILLVFLVAWFANRPARRLARDRLLLALPFVRHARFHAAIGRIARLISTAIGAGADVRQAVGLAADGGGDRVFALRLADVKSALHGGAELAEAFERAGGFGREFLEWARTAEASGDLEAAFGRIADDSEERARRATGVCATLLSGIIIACAFAY
ncbi:MAG: type II secretion system F family protein, partial [Planctomycetes bacterium]|nr:type II secretion system F family protein [Planctomycetota bacterium]